MKQTILRIGMMLSLAVMLVMPTASHGIADATNYRTFIREILTPDHLNNLQTHYTTKLNEIIDKFPGDSLSVVLVATDTLTAKIIGRIMVKDPLVSVSALDSMLYHLANFKRVNADTIVVTGSVTTDTLTATGTTTLDTLTVTGPATVDTITSTSLAILDTARIDSGRITNLTSTGTTLLDTLTATGPTTVDTITSTSIAILDTSRQDSTNINKLSVFTSANFTGATVTGLNFSTATLVDTSRLDIRDTTIVTMNGKRVLKGKLTDDAWNCVNPTFAGATFNCAGSYDRFRALEKSNSIHTTRSAQAAADSGNQWPTYWQAQITTNGDSLVIYDRAIGKVYVVILKAANNACGNNTFADLDFKDGVLYVATSGGLCVGDYLADTWTFYSTSGVGRYLGNWQTRNAAATTLTVAASPAIVNNTVSSISTVRDAFGKRDALQRLTHWWMMTSSAAAGQSVFNPANGGIWDEGSAVISQWGTVSPTGELIYDHDNGTIHTAWAYKYSIFSITADSWGENDFFRNDGSGGLDMAWTNAAVTSRFAFSPRASIAGGGASVLTAGNTEGAYFVHLKPGNATNGAKIRLTNSYIAAPEFGDCVLSAVNGDNTTDASPYAISLTANNSPTFKSPSSTIVFSGAYSSKGNSYLSKYSPAGNIYRLTAAQQWTIQGAFKSQSATNPSAAQLLFQTRTKTGGFVNTILIGLDTDGSVYMNQIDSGGNADSVPASTKDVCDANWHHVSVTRYNNAITVYIDGIQYGQDASLVSTGTVLTDSLTVGSSVDGSSPFYGQLSNWSYSKVGITSTQAYWLAQRMLASLKVEPNGRKLHALDVDYVQSYGTNVVMGDEDSCVVWDAVLGLPIPGKRYGYTPSTKTIQDATLDGAGPDSLSLTIVTTTETRTIEPNPRIIDMANNRGPFVQPAVGERVVVDSAGVAGLFWAVDDAVDAGYNAGVTFIKISAGTYSPFTIDHAGITIEGSGNVPGSRGAGDKVTQIKGTGSSAAITYTSAGYYSTLSNLDAYTAPGGGGGGYDAISMPSNTNEVKLFNVSVSGADDDCIDMVGGQSQFGHLFLSACDGWGIRFTTGDDNIFNDNHIINGASGSIQVNAGSTGNMCDGNRLDGAVSGTCTGTNDVTAY